MFMLLRSLLIAASLCALPVQAAVTLGDHVEHYDISGSTPADLRREMNAKGPQGAGGKRFDGYTRWHVSWRYQYNHTAGGCAIASVTTSAKVTITLPRWTNEGGAGGSSRQQWARYLAALENTSRDIAATASMPPMKSIAPSPPCRPRPIVMRWARAQTPWACVFCKNTTSVISITTATLITV